MGSVATSPQKEKTVLGRWGHGIANIFSVVQRLYIIEHWALAIANHGG
jgi:hypothetical protein